MSQLNMMMETGTIEVADTAEVAMAVAEAEVTVGEAGVDTPASQIISRKATAMPTTTRFPYPTGEEVSLSLTYLTTPLINEFEVEIDLKVYIFHLRPWSRPWSWSWPWPRPDSRKRSQQL